MWAFNAGRNTFDLHKAIIGLETLFWFSFEWPFKTGFTVFTVSIFCIPRSANVQCDNRAYPENTNFETSVPRNLKFHTFGDLHTTKKC